MTEYDYKIYIDRLYDKLQIYNDGASKKLSLPKPVVTAANKKTHVSNFRLLCTKLNRDELDVSKYIEQELSTQSSIDGSGGLKLNGIFRLLGIQKILTNYIDSYIHCKECSGYVTDILKENRITYIKCKICLSKKAIN